jgi:hypothetical protein
MVAGHNTSALLGIGATPEALSPSNSSMRRPPNIQLAAGMSLACGGAKTGCALERSMDLSLRSRGSAPNFRPSERE